LTAQADISPGWPNQGDIPGGLPNHGDLHGGLPTQADISPGLPNQGSIPPGLSTQGDLHGGLPNQGDIPRGLPNQGHIHPGLPGSTDLFHGLPSGQDFLGESAYKAVIAPSTGPFQGQAESPSTESVHVEKGSRDLMNLPVYEENLLLVLKAPVFNNNSESELAVTMGRLTAGGYSQDMEAVMESYADVLCADLGLFEAGSFTSFSEAIPERRYVQRMLYFFCPLL